MDDIRARVAEMTLQLPEKPSERHHENEVDRRHRQVGRVDGIRLRADDVAALREVAERDVPDDRRVLHQHDELVAECGQHIADRLRKDDLEHRLPVAEAERAPGLHLPRIDGHDARAQDLRLIRARVDTEGEDRNRHLVERLHDDEVADQELHHHRRSPDDREIHLRERVEDGETTVLVVRRTDDGDEEPDHETERNRRQRDFKRDAEPVPQVMPAFVLDEAKVKVVDQGLEHAAPLFLFQLVRLGRVGLHPLREPTVRLELGNRLVDRLQQLGLPLPDRDGVLLGRDEVRKRKVGLALHAVLRRVDVGDDDIDAARLEGRHGRRRRIEALGLLLELLRHERLARRAALHANLLALRIRPLRVRRRLLVDEHDARLHVGHREVDVLLAVLRDRDARRREVGLPRNDRRDDGIEVDRLDRERPAELRRDRLADLHVDADDFLSAQELIRRERRLRDHLEGLVLLRASRKQNHRRQRNHQFLHVHLSSKT